MKSRIALLFGDCLKTVKINNGNVYLYNSPVLAFDRRTFATNSYNELVLNGYEGQLGLNDVSLNVSGNTALRGFLKFPAYINTNGLVDLIIPPNMNLSVRSSQDGGTVDGVALDGGSTEYSYGKALYEYAVEHFREGLLNEDFEIKSGSGIFYIDSKYDKPPIRYPDLCKKFNLIYINAIVSEQRYAPHITRKNSIEEIVNSSPEELESLMLSFASSEDFENAAIVKNKLNAMKKI